VLITNALQATSLAAVSPGLVGMVIVAPHLAADTVVAVDVAAPFPSRPRHTWR